VSLRPLTPQERSDALRKAAAARATRAEAKERLKTGELTIANVISAAESDDAIARMRIVELLEALPGVDIIDRGTVNAFDDARVSRAVEATGRKRLIFAGVSLEICAAFPAMTAVGKGLDAYVAVDACGTFSETKREVGLLRMLQAGVVTTDYASLMVEILKDNSRPDAGAIYGAIDMPWAKLVGQIAQAYGR